MEENASDHLGEDKASTKTNVKISFDVILGGTKKGAIIMVAII